MICKTFSAGICGIDAYRTCVEADVSAGLPAFTMVGLPSSEVREAKERVERAIVNSGFEFPSRRITINLSPANLKKQGSGLDLPIAVAILAAMEEVSEKSIENLLFLGELSLDGRINPVKGVLPVAAFARDQRIKGLVIPRANVFEGAVIDGVDIYAADDLKTLIHQLNKGLLEKAEHIDLDKALSESYSHAGADFLDVVGQEKAKRATAIAAAGFHNILYIGPPGAGKSMTAERIPTIFNRMTKEECLEVSKIYSIAGLLKNDSLVLSRPFRAPHQSITEQALLGGTGNPKPGEVTLAHKGILFLDELTEFKRSVIDGLRTPIEEKKVIISRAAGRAEFPSDFMLVAATNPCKCGYYPDRRYCRCDEADVIRYLSKIKGPVLDRIDICVGIQKVESACFKERGEGLSSADMREMVEKARRVQSERFKELPINFNSQMSKPMVDQVCQIDMESMLLMRKAYDRFNMTARGWYRILKVSRTIADMEGEEKILKKHILEAISYRNSFVNN